MGPGSRGKEHGIKKKKKTKKPCPPTLTNSVSVNKKLVYVPHLENLGMTMLIQEAIITVKGISLWRHMEKFKDKHYVIQCEEWPRCLERGDQQT